MNKYQEAFEDLCITWDEEGMGKDHFQDQYPYLYNTIKELVDKETPTKVTHQATIHSCCTCPNCLNVVDEFEEDYLGRRVRITFDYCRFCGQKLDWGDTND